MDEPFAALDEITRFRLNDDLLRAVARERLHRGLRHALGLRERVPVDARIAVMTSRPGRVLKEIGMDLPSERRTPCAAIRLSGAVRGGLGGVQRSLAGERA